MTNKMELRFSASLDNEPLARLAIATFISNSNPSLSMISEIKTIVSEGVSNAIIHGYKCDPSKEVIIKCLLEDTILHLQIIDNGCGIENISLARTPHFTTRPDLERAGMGITIMDCLSDGFSLSSVVGMGTKVTIRKCLVDEDEVQRATL